MIDWSLVRYDIPLVLFCCFRDDGLEFFLFLSPFFDYSPGCINTPNLTISFLMLLLHFITAGYLCNKNLN